MPELREFFRSDAFVPTTAIFPSIDADLIASELRLSGEGTARGAKNQPGPDEDGFDSVEGRVLERIGDLRRKGIDNYAINRRVYDSRLARAAEARKEAEFVAGKAKGDFHAAVKIWKARMASPCSRVTDVFRALHAYRKSNRLDRPAYEPQHLMKWLAVVVGLLLAESALNAVLFAEESALGLVGGWMIAGLISLVNISAASLTAYFSRNLNHLKWRRKFFGLLVVAGGISGIILFNLAVAHFRDALEGSADWNQAARSAWTSVLETPQTLDSIMSALLMALGLLAALLAALKTYHSMDPYPGYARVEASVRRARDVYADDLVSAISNLDTSRDEAIETLKEANAAMRLGINEAVDALYGQTSLRGELDRFLEHCDEKVNLLLTIYRGANRDGRAAPPNAIPVPAHFEKAYAFPSYLEHAPAEPRREEALREREEVGDLVSRSIEEINADYRASVDAYPDIQDLETFLEATPRGPVRRERGPVGAFDGSRPHERPAEPGKGDDGMARLPRTRAEKA